METWQKCPKVSAKLCMHHLLRLTCNGLSSSFCPTYFWLLSAHEDLLDHSLADPIHQSQASRAYHHTEPSGSAQRHIETSPVCHETHVTAAVGAHQTEDDDLTLATCRRQVTVQPTAVAKRLNCLEFNCLRHARMAEMDLLSGL